MVIDMGYWTRVTKRIITIIVSIVLIFFAFKLAVFYIPFLIAFIISLMIEPIIKIIVKKTRLTRKTTAILILFIVCGLIIGLSIWGIGSLISEISNLLATFNEYVEKISVKIEEIISQVNFEKIRIPDNVKNAIGDSAMNFVGNISNWVKNILMYVMNFITAIPKIAIYLIITILALYFICADKIYIIDQIEHHLPKTWVRKLSSHTKELISSLGGYLKAEAILILIAFIIVLVGLTLLKWFGFNIQYPLLFAFGIGFVDALPILGSGTVIVPWAVISGVNGDIELAIALIILYAIILVMRQVLEPKIVSNHIGIHPIFTLIAMYTGFKIIGVLGLFIGPIILIILNNIFGGIIDKGVVKSILDR